jgi:hypothetical protein
MTYTRAKAGLEILEEIDVSSSTLSERPWHIETQAASDVFAKMERAGVPLQEITARFGTGIQTGADRLLTLDAPTARSRRLERELLRPILKGRDVRRYSVNRDPKLLIFPYSIKQGNFAILDESVLRDFKRTYNYLQPLKSRLAERIWFGKNATELSGKWYGMMYLDSHASFAAPHLLTPSLSNRSNFAPGTGDLFATGTAGVTSIVPRKEFKEGILYLLGVLNSFPISFYATHHSPAFSGGYFKFSAPYLSRLPIRLINFSDGTDRSRHRKMVALVERTLGLHKRMNSTRIAPSEAERLERAIAATEAEIDDLVFELYAITTKERKTIEGAVP